MLMKLFGSRALAALLAVLLSVATADAQIVNPTSAFPVNVDGQFSGGGEWSDITPAWFHSDTTTGATPVPAGNASANSLLFAGLAKDTPASDPELYLMYDFLGRQSLPTTPGEFLGNVNFPVTVAGGASRNLTVTFNENATVTGATVSIDLHDGTGPHDPAVLGIEGAVGFGTTPASIVGAGSPFATIQHELIELGVPLLIPAGFGSPGSSIPQGGVRGDNKGDGYSPAPAFWNANANKSPSVDPPISSAIFQINPNGSTLIQPLPMPMPEPSTFVLAGLGALGLWGIARKRRLSA
jgi:hypothetical protein